MLVAWRLRAVSVKAAQREAAEEAAARLGLAVETTAEAALAEALNLAHGFTRYHAGKVAELSDEERAWGTRTRRQVVTTTADGQPERTDTTTLTSGPSVNETQARLWNQQRKEIGAEIFRLGIEERQVRVNEELGAALSRALAGARRELEAGRLTAAEYDARVVELHLAELREIAGDDAQPGPAA